MNENLILKLKEIINSSDDEEIADILELCISALSDWSEICCGDCGEIFYAPECDCLRPESKNHGKHPLLKLFLRSE